MLATLVWIALSHSGLDRLGKPLGTDFVSFWTASRLALDGAPALAYDPAAHLAAQRALFPDGRDDYYAFFYPPPFLLLCLPLALLPYLGSLTLWLVAGFVSLFVSLRSLLPQRWALLPILAFPGVLVNAGHGQNGFLTAACFGGGLVLLERRPLAAGLCLGALVIKPHLALTVPIALVAARRWTALAGAAISATGLCAAAWLALGGDAWRGFLAATSLARATMEAGLVDPAKMASTFAAIRLLGCGIDSAYAAQGAVTLAGLAVLASVASRRPSAAAEGAMLAASAMLCTPFLLDYDLATLALPLAWVTAEAQRTGWHAWEKLTLLAAFALPLVARPLAMAIALPVAPLAIGATALVVARRATPVARYG